jgi:hypothetical protein
MPVRRLLGGGLGIGQIDAEPVPQADLAGLGHGDEVASISRVAIQRRSANAVVKAAPRLPAR